MVWASWLAMKKKKDQRVWRQWKRRKIKHLSSQPLRLSLSVPLQLLLLSRQSRNFLQQRLNHNFHHHRSKPPYFLQPVGHHLLHLDPAVLVPPPLLLHPMVLHVLRLRLELGWLLVKYTSLLWLSGKRWVSIGNQRDLIRSYCWLPSLLRIKMYRLFVLWAPYWAQNRGQSQPCRTSPSCSSCWGSRAWGSFPPPPPPPWLSRCDKP